MQRAASGKTKKPATRNQRKHPYLLFRPTAKKIDDTVGIRIAHGGVLVGRSPSWYARVQIPVVQRLFEKEGQGGGQSQSQAPSRAGCGRRRIRRILSFAVHSFQGFCTKYHAPSSSEKLQCNHRLLFGWRSLGRVQGMRKRWEAAEYFRISTIHGTNRVFLAKNGGIREGKDS